MVEFDGRREIRNHSRRHMWSVSSTTPPPPLVLPLLPSSSSSTTNCFFKDGCQVSVGECALFKLAQNSPPLVGIIRSLTSDKETNLTLSVNWLYRPAEVELSKGVALEAAPNEVFYTFHRDEIPAASFLHRCKVTFLPKGVELPAGVSSFVCRRVYDITNSCLWWLTDQDYIDEQQEEVDQLLRSTLTKMHASAEQQQGTHSPKSMNGSVATSPQKHSPDSVQNSVSNFPSQKKGKKRDRGDQSSEPVKRERTSRVDGGESGQVKSDCVRRVEISKLTERGLVDSEAVARLVRLMHPEKSRRKIDLTERSMLAGIIAATDKHDCLSQFVQLKGIPVLDDWLQEAHKGKLGGNLKDCDKAVEDFLLVLLGALDKLPVNLNALQMCNIGKSVNHLRSHRNSDIQKKARSLVDTWKKRVEAEMNINDTKSGSPQMVQWPSKSCDGSHNGNKQSGVSSEAAIRFAATHHSSLKSNSVKHLQGESNLMPGYAHHGNARLPLSPASTTINCKDAPSRIANGEAFEQPQTIREEKSSSSSQSHTNSQCSSDHVRSLTPVGKEDARRSSVASKSLIKAPGSGSRHKKSANDSFSGVNKDTPKKETILNKSPSVSRSSLVERVSQNASDVVVHEGNNQKLIVKIPNRGRGPAQTGVGAFVDDVSCRNSTTSSPVVLENHDLSEVCLREKCDTCQLHEVNGSLAAVHSRSSATKVLPNTSKSVYSPPRSEKKIRNTHDSSFSSMNALVESCVKFSEANALMSAGDDVGMNLLASVAAGEICMAHSGSPTVSPLRNLLTAEKSGILDCTNEKEFHGDDVIKQEGQSTDIAGTNDCSISSGPPPKVIEEEATKHSITAEVVPQNGEGCSLGNGVSGELLRAACSIENNASDVRSKVSNEKNGDVTCGSHNQPSVGSHVGTEESVKKASTNDKSDKETYKDGACASVDAKDDLRSNVCTGLKTDCSVDQNLGVVPLQSEPLNTDEKPAGLHPEAVDGTIKVETAAGVGLCGHGVEPAKKQLDRDDGSSKLLDKREDSKVQFADIAQDTVCKDDNLDNKEVVLQSRESGIQAKSTGDNLPDELHSSTKQANLIAVKNEAKQDNAAAVEHAVVSPTSGGLGVVSKLGFDLNEDLWSDDGNYAETVSMAGSSCPADVCSGKLLQVPVSASAGVNLASVTDSAPFKGSFVPPDELLRDKMKLGWKGSAATSAFHPAEPRRLIELPPSKALHTGDVITKQLRSPLDIDLNVADDTCGEESNFIYNSVSELTSGTPVRGSGGFDLDLNKADEAPGILQPSAGTSLRVDVSIPSIKAMQSSIFFNGEPSKRDFDLNDGLATEEMPTERPLHSQPAQNNILFQPTLFPRISSDAGNLFSWYPPGASYSVSMTPSALHDRPAFPVVVGGGPHRIMGGPTSSIAFNPDAFRGSVLSSSPAMPFQSTPYQYPVFPFGNSFPPPSALAGGPSGYVDAAATGRISTFPSQLAGNAVGVTFQYPHAYVPRPDISSNGVFESNQKCGKQILDLNSGPGCVDLEGRIESLPGVSRQISIISSQPLLEEQARVYGMGGGVIKRKEPEGGWSSDKLSPKESWWR